MIFYLLLIVIFENLKDIKKLIRCFRSSQKKSEKPKYSNVNQSEVELRVLDNSKTQFLPVVKFENASKKFGSYYAVNNLNLSLFRD